MQLALRGKGWQNMPLGGVTYIRNTVPFLQRVD